MRATFENDKSNLNRGANMAMKVIKCPDCGHELARVILGGGTNQTKSCAGCGSRFRIIKDSICAEKAV